LYFVVALDIFSELLGHLAPSRRVGGKQENWKASANHSPLWQNRKNVHWALLWIAGDGWLVISLQPAVGLTRRLLICSMRNMRIHFLKKKLCKEYKNSVSLCV
jgi:hypothetical protein